jgi:hypothetical protein
MVTLVFRICFATRYCVLDVQLCCLVDRFLGTAVRVTIELCSGLLTDWIEWSLASTPKARKLVVLLTVLFNTRHVLVNYTIIAGDEQ